MNELDEFGRDTLWMSVAKLKGYHVETETQNNITRYWVMTPDNFAITTGSITEPLAWINASYFMPAWTQNIEAAWELVEEMITNNRKFHLLRYGYTPAMKKPIVWEVLYGSHDVNLLPYTRDESATVAICRAYLAWKKNQP